jgi:flagellar basal body-associated protein FliL
MADEKIEQKAAENTADAPAKPDANAPAEKSAAADKTKGVPMLPWIIIAAVVLVSAGAGLGLGLLFAGSGEPEAAPAPPQNQPPVAERPVQSELPAGPAENIWYFNLEPVVANLDEPGATRYVRAALTLEMSGEMAVEKGTALLEQKKPLLTNLLTIYLSGLNIESTRGDKNLKRIQFEICEMFNERLFPDSKGLIKGILIKEFAVQ